jgi:hypothetical protein
MPDGHRKRRLGLFAGLSITVLSGTARLGMGESANADKENVFGAGSFYATSPGMVHYLAARR